MPQIYRKDNGWSKLNILTDFMRALVYMNLCCHRCLHQRRGHIVVGVASACRCSINLPKLGLSVFASTRSTTGLPIVSDMEQHDKLLVQSYRTTPFPGWVDGTDRPKIFDPRMRHGGQQQRRWASELVQINKHAWQAKQWLQVCVLRGWWAMPAVGVVHTRALYTIE